VFALTATRCLSKGRETEIEREKEGGREGGGERERRESERELEFNARLSESCMSAERGTHPRLLDPHPANTHASLTPTPHSNPRHSHPIPPPPARSPLDPTSRSTSFATPAQSAARSSPPRSCRGAAARRRGRLCQRREALRPVGPPLAQAPATSPSAGEAAAHGSGAATAQGHDRQCERGCDDPGHTPRHNDWPCHKPCQRGCDAD
jgi:hypothetical protein